MSPGRDPDRVFSGVFSRDENPPEPTDDEIVAVSGWLQQLMPFEAPVDEWQQDPYARR